MIQGQSSKWVSLITPQSVATNATASATVNAVGWHYAEVMLHLATQTAASTDVALTLTESDGTTYVTATDLAVTTVAPDTSNAQMYLWRLDLRKRKKNLKITFTPGVGARIGSAVVRLSRPEQSPANTASGAGVTALGGA